MELAHDDFLKSLKQEQDRNITLLRQEFERKASEVQKNYEKKMKTVRERLEERRKRETAAIEFAKNQHIEQLMKAHEKAFAEIKNYYNDITHNNLDLIKSLKEEVAEMRRKEQQDEKQMEHIAQENRRMSEPFKKARHDVEQASPSSSIVGLSVVVNRRSVGRRRPSVVVGRRPSSSVVGRRPSSSVVGRRPSSVAIARAAVPPRKNRLPSSFAVFWRRARPERDPYAGRSMHTQRSRTVRARVSALPCPVVV